MIISKLVKGGYVNSKNERIIDGVFISRFDYAQIETPIEEVIQNLLIYGFVEIELNQYTNNGSTYWINQKDDSVWLMFIPF